MGGLNVLCVGLALACAALLVRQLLLKRRLRRLTARLEEFLQSDGAPVDVALEEDDLARLQNAIADLQQSLLRQRQLNAQESARTSDLTADISHQLKTPLTTLRLYTELDGAAHMEASLAQIQRMEDLIQALLRLERLNCDGYSFTFAPAQARELLLEQWQSLQAVWPDKHLTIHGSAAIRCDRRWLGEALGNLLKNACQHTRPDGHIQVTLERTEAAFFCVIEDDGGGVPPEELPKLFRRFYRAEESSSAGAGLGLAIARAIIRRHHGTITAENGANGLKMTISLPMLDRNLTNL